MLMCYFTHLFLVRNRSGFAKLCSCFLLCMLKKRGLSNPLIKMSHNLTVFAASQLCLQVPVHKHSNNLITKVHKRVA